MSTASPNKPIGIEEPHTPGAARQRVAAALGWDRQPELTDEQIRDADEKLAAARRQRNAA